MSEARRIHDAHKNAAAEAASPKHSYLKPGYGVWIKTELNDKITTQEEQE